MGWRRAAGGVRAVAVAAAVASAVAAAVASGSPAARAATPSFTAPVQLATASYGLAAAAATDATGTTTAVVTGSGAPKLLERPAGSPWPAPTRLPGDPRGMKGPVLAAAGQGALGIAWRVDTPRKYAGIQAALRDPRGALSTPIVVATDDAGGVRHPAIAVDQTGDALLAYNAHTRKTHLSMRGAIAVAYRPAGGTFAEPIVVDDTASLAPVVALAPDGSGLVAWARRGRIYGVSVADGQIGRVKRLATPNGVGSLSVTAAPRGEATVAWIDRRNGGRRYQVFALHRRPGHAFARPQTLRRANAYIGQLALAADERGQTTAAWTEEESQPSKGSRGIRTTVRSATAAPGHAFGASRVVAANGSQWTRSLSAAAANGRVALTWGYRRDSRHVGVQAAVGPATALGPAQTIVAPRLTGRFYVTPPDARATIAPGGAATVFAVVPEQAKPDQITSRLVAVDGR
jgi:hypothetical protein